MNYDKCHFNADNFKRWMKNHPDSGTDECNMVGVEVQAKFGVKKTMKNMTVESGKAGRVIREFMENGGVVRDVSGEEYLVEVSSGKFTINRRMLVI